MWRCGVERVQVPNASPTAGSASTDLYGMAVLDACRQVNERLKPYRSAVLTQHATQAAVLQVISANNLLTLKGSVLGCCRGPYCKSIACKGQPTRGPLSAGRT